MTKSHFVLPPLPDAADNSILNTNSTEIITNSGQIENKNSDNHSIEFPLLTELKKPEFPPIKDQQNQKQVRFVNEVEEMPSSPISADSPNILSNIFTTTTENQLKIRSACISGKSKPVKENENIIDLPDDCSTVIDTKDNKMSRLESASCISGRNNFINNNNDNNNSDSDANNRINSCGSCSPDGNRSRNLESSSCCCGGGNENTVVHLSQVNSNS